MQPVMMAENIGNAHDRNASTDLSDTNLQRNRNWENTSIATILNVLIIFLKKHRCIRDPACCSILFVFQKETSHAMCVWGVRNRNRIEIDTERLESLSVVAKQETPCGNDRVCACSSTARAPDRPRVRLTDFCVANGIRYSHIVVYYRVRTLVLHASFGRPPDSHKYQDISSDDRPALICLRALLTQVFKSLFFGMNAVSFFSFLI